MTNETKHTPGPWHLNDAYGTDRIEINGGRLGGRLCWLGQGGEFTYGSLEDTKATRANAALIAAAPDLLQACKDALEVLDTAKQYFPKSIKNRDKFHLLNVEENSIRKAIDKAEGRL